MPKKTKKFPTLRALVSGFAEGAISPEQMNEVLDAIELGIALSKRDRAVAEALETAPPSIEEHPIYLAGFEAGVASCRNPYLGISAVVADASSEAKA